MKRVLGAWTLTLCGPLFMAAPLLNPDLESPAMAVGIGLFMTIAGGLMMRSLWREKQEAKLAAGSSGAPRP